MSVSLVQQPLPVPIPPQPSAFLRKRTSSFSYPTCDTALFSPNPRPCKSPRVADSMGSPLRRSETMLSIPTTNGSTGTGNDAAAAPACTGNSKEKDAACYRVLQRHKEDRLRRKGLTRSHSEYFDLTTSRPRLEVTPPRAATAAATQPRASTSSPSSKPTSSTSTSSPSHSAAPSSSPSPAKLVLNPKPRKPSPITTITPSPPSFTPVYTKKRPAPSTPPQVILPSASSPIPILRTQRTSSPLSPVPHTLPGRPVFPRSKPEPDLYRTAIKMRMRGSPEGLRMLHMGPRLAMSIMNATKELEKIVADQAQQERDRDNDVVMGDATAAPTNLITGTSSIAMPVLTASWVVVKGEDWEMVDCAA